MVEVHWIICCSFNSVKRVCVRLSPLSPARCFDCSCIVVYLRRLSISYDPNRTRTPLLNAACRTTRVISFPPSAILVQSFNAHNISNYCRDRAVTSKMSRIINCHLFYWVGWKDIPLHDFFLSILHSLFTSSFFIYVDSYILSCNSGTWYGSILIFDSLDSAFTFSTIVMYSPDTPFFLHLLYIPKPSNRSSAIAL